MATDGGNISEDTEMTECDGDKVVTMMDVLQEQQEFEDDANAVLGASDDKNCTYAMGYIKRQALYACVTCCPDAKTDPTKRTGVCLACSLNCHENHELVELYTKRNFRCDCGNPNFSSHPCQFTPSKPDLNEDNIYNQNFSGLYCICQRPYPDPEATFEDDMIQCIVCEDWLHAAHLDAVVPGSDQYSEMICKGCMEKNEFLHDYSNIAVNVESADVDILAVNGDAAKEILTNGNTDTSKDVPNGIEAEKADTNAKNEDDAITSKDNEQTEQTKTEENSEKMDLDTESAKEQATGANDDEALSTEEKSTENTELNEASKELASETHEDNNKQLTDDANNGDSNKTEDPQGAEEEPVDGSEKQEDGKVSSDSTEPKPNSDVETSNIEVPDTSQKENDKTDAVMDAIDELLKDPSEVKDTKSQDEEPSETLPDNNDKTENTETPQLNDTKMAEPENEEKTSNDDTIADSVKTKSAEVETADGDKNENESQTETEQKSAEVADKELNGDVSNICETNNTSKLEGEISNGKNNVSETAESINENKRKLSVEVVEENSPKKAKLDSKCTRPKGVKKVHKGATFWPSNFRQKLCICGECISMYKDLQVLFLTDIEDTMSAYESLGKEKVDGGASQYEKGLQALSSLDRIQQINALTEYNNMRDKLLDFLKSFKDRKEVVKEEDIKAFFAGMKAKREPDGVYFCR